MISKITGVGPLDQVVRHIVRALNFAEAVHPVSPLEEDDIGGGGTVTSIAGGVGITNTPEPIVGVGTVDLDLNSLTTTADPLAPGDLFGFVDVSVGVTPASQRKIAFSALESSLTLANLGGAVTDAQVPDTITLANLTQVTVRSHASLQNLTADDHTNYFLLAGRAGAQSATLSTSAAGTYYGSSAAGQNLVLQANSAADGEGSIVIERPGVWTTAAFGFANLIDLCPSGLSLTGPPVFHFINATPIVTVNTTTPFISLFSDGVTVQPASGAITGLGVHTGVGVERQFKNSTAAACTGTYTGVFCNPLLENTGAGSIAISVMKAIGMAGTIGTGTSVADYTGLSMDGAALAGAITTVRCVWAKNARASGAGTIQDFVCIDIADQTVPSGLKVSLRSAGSAVDLRHAGPALFGQNAAPNANLKLDVDGGFATRAANVAAANGTNNDLAIGNRSFARITGPTAAFSISSVTGGVDGKRLVIRNTTTQIMTLTHEAGTGTAANRFHMPDGVDVVSTGESIAEFIYDATTARWVYLGSIL